MTKWDIEWVYNGAPRLDEIEAESEQAAKDAIKARYVERLAAAFEPDKLIILSVEPA